MRWRSYLLSTLQLLVISTAHAAPPQYPFEPAPERLAQLQQMLTPGPLRLGPSIDDRPAWEKLAAALGNRDLIQRARELAAEPIPETPRELYLDFSRTGNRDRYQGPYFRKRERLSNLVVAECLANQGEFLTAIEQTIAAICDEPTWCLPAHDRSLNNLKNRQRTIDLFIAETSWDLAVASQWLGDRLRLETHQRIREQLELQTFAPFELSVRTAQPKHFWLQITNNWNSVCLAGVTGAALATIESPERRAFYVAAAEKFIENFLAGFGESGYCTEGISYWNYGVGHYLDLAEVVRAATNSQIDWYTRPRTRTIASSAWNLQMAPGIYPSFADAPLNSRANLLYATLLSWRLNLPPIAVATPADLVRSARRIHLFELGLIVHPMVAQDFAVANADPGRKSERVNFEWGKTQRSGRLLCQRRRRDRIGARDDRRRYRQAPATYAAWISADSTSERSNHNNHNYEK